MIGLKDSRQFFNQWEAKPKPFAPCTRYFSRASSELQVIARNCDWFIALFVPVVIGRSNCFGFGFSTVIWKPLYPRHGTIQTLDNRVQVDKSVRHNRLISIQPTICYHDGQIDENATKLHKFHLILINPWTFDCAIYLRYPITGSVRISKQRWKINRPF